jgi:23S rRNA (cytosine1962-C5)-methyltransferase
LSTTKSIARRARLPLNAACIMSARPEQTNSLIVFEDDDLLVVNKPAGWNTHAPSPYAGEGVYDWLRHREPRWASLAIIHRLDKETSGILAFAKTALANQSLTDQFSRRLVKKRYVLATDRPVGKSEIKVSSEIERAGTRYIARPARPGAIAAETRFRLLSAQPGQSLVEAEPLTGRTHQIRVHAAKEGLPILGDVLYGGTPWRRVCLHASSLTFIHPRSGQQATFETPPEFGADVHQHLRSAVIDLAESDAWRCVHGAADGWPGWYVDRIGSAALSQGDSMPSTEQVQFLQTIPGVLSIYHKHLHRQLRRTTAAEVSPECIRGEPVPEPFVIQENGIRFEVSFREGYSIGLFLDQRDNRRRLLVNHVGAGFPLFEGGVAGKTVLNAFSYTCGFSVCAAKPGARATSLDLSKKYLEWGKRNFRLNGIEPEEHEFIYGDAMNWMIRLSRKKRLFDVVLLDPPTFSQSKEFGVFRVEKDYERLVMAALGVLRPAGVLFASTNAATLEPGEFVARVEHAVAKAGRTVLQRLYVPQPPDFPINRAEPGYLKTLWLRVR